MTALVQRPGRYPLIVTADDFGLTIEVNEAVEDAHRRGILTAASLMVGAPAAADAIKRAKRLPHLGVGLHVTLTDGLALTAHRDAPILVSPTGHFHGRMVETSFRLAVDARLRSEMRREILAQFEAFQRTGLPLDHVDSHKHFHVHPMIFEDIVTIGKGFGLRAIRFPYERLVDSMRISGSMASRRLDLMVLRCVLAHMRRRIRHHRLYTNDIVLGLGASGSMDRLHLLRALSCQPGRLTEIYLHPATVSGAAVTPSAPRARHHDEYLALLDPDVHRALAAGDWRLTTFSQMLA